MATEAIASAQLPTGGLTGQRDEFTAALERILASQAFSRSGGLTAFLRHVCVSALDGQEKQLSEQRIGTAVFGRPDHYNPSDDTIVRSTARLLRQRLDQYYDNEGRTEAFRIAIPRGAYVPVFVPAPAPHAADDPATSFHSAAMPPPATGPAPAAMPIAAHAAAVETSRWQRWCRSTLAPAVMLLVLAAMTGLWWQARDDAAHGPAQEASARFWSTMLPADRDTTLIVSDNGLVMYQGDTRREVPLADYIANRPGAADTPALEVERYNARRYTGMSSVTLAAELGKLASAAPQRYHVRFSRDVKLADLKHDNTILVGVEQSNPWWALYRNQFNFHIDWDSETGDFLILNEQPRNGERARYPFSARDPARRGYALIGFKRNLSGDGHTLLIGGTTSAGTDAAIEFMMSPAQLAPLIRQAQRADGGIGNFEVLLQCVLQANGSTDIAVLGTRVAPR